MIGIIFENFVFVYGLAMLFIYALLALLSNIGVRLFKKRSKYTDYSLLLDSPLTPGISVIAPAFNEGVTIISNVRSLLTLNYTRFEVIIINDGSTDDTLQKLIDEFEMVEVDFAYNERIITRPVRKFFKSTNSAYDKLLVIDKVNGKSKADASNAGINAAAFDYFLCTDVDCILEKDTLSRMIHPFLNEFQNKTKEVGEPCPECGYVHIVEDSTRVIASGATLRIANSSEVDEGVMVRVRPPSRYLPRFQEMEYIRAYVLGKMGWSMINAVPNVSGGLGLFDKEIAIKAGGYDHQSFAEDMDIVTRMCGYMLDNNLKYAIRYIPTTQCWTEGPPNMKVFSRQRTRWGRGLAEIITIHRHLLFNPRYKQLGLVVLPYNLLFEFLAPIIEALGLVSIIWLALTGQINWPYARILLLFVYLYSVMITTLALCWDQITYPYYKTTREVFGLTLMAFLEPFIYHPLIVFYALRGYWFFLIGKKTSWGNMQRQGFAPKKPN
ncbi:Glycosyltransferase, catalytic subunit of cellulose synthase and poly-beta-1,6-N-acetylglucosamine synthase [Chitinophaga jiangningensis]|uniref:Glycosyltransferase, catalytic subunit of cellulose synthase and poly-beta-1,6-N-acetylglucosamine synthase n=1 Tax=Chitinophaga jiangningensis TaxID=1419482 RepID=A0A1M7BR09_9BACT|nr:glycosyltransferase [Chitinophaga jiangningensis]SHL57306.1 Glycosyltransferase, catalytic subunit of cellulose synthase and poly-beta-1,6-N-acetylglucosamine synthase [Chitinophaga jiangningensis]